MASVSVLNFIALDLFLLSDQADFNYAISLRIDMKRRWEEGFRMGNTCTPVADAC